MDLKGLVIPRRDLFHKKYIGDTLQTSRGCPNDCEFCSVSQFNGFAYRERPVEEVLDEISTLKKKYLFIVDDNIVGLGPERENWAISFARGIIEKKHKLAWYSHAALNVADNDEVLRAFGESGCRLLFLGMESEDHEVLKSMNKKVNLTRDYERVIRKIHENHIGIHGSFIFGTDEDTIEKLQRRFNFMLENHIDVIQYCTLTPYPGTKLFDQLLSEGRLYYTDFPSDWARYDLTEILFKPQNLDIDEYGAIMRKMGRTIFSLRNRAKMFLRSFRDTRSLQTAAWCLFTNSIYSAPENVNGQSGEKFWHFSQKSWPAIHLFERIEKHF